MKMCEIVRHPTPGLAQTPRDLTASFKKRRWRSSSGARNTTPVESNPNLFSSEAVGITVCYNWQVHYQNCQIEKRLP